MSITLRQLKIFESTARLGRLTAAAEEQALSQSAASQALKELESGLHYRLFNRNGRELVLTDAGREILPRVRDMLDLADSLKTPGEGGISGTLRVAASVTIASYLLPKLMAAFIDRYPGVEPDLQIANSQKVLTQLERGQAHVGLIEGPAQHPQLQITPWQEDCLEVFCYPDHPLANKAQLSAEQIREQRWILREPGSGTRAVFDLALQRIGAEVKSVMALNRQEAIKQSVRAGLGVGCLSRLSVAEEVLAGKLVLLNSPLDLSRRLSLVRPPEGGRNLLAQTFIAYLEKQGLERGRLTCSQ